MPDATHPTSLQAPVSKQYSEIDIILNDIYNTDARMFIFGHIAQIRDFWYELKTTSSLPLHTKCGDPCWMHCLEHLDRIVESDIPIYSRLAYVELVSVLDALKRSIQKDRKMGLLKSSIGRRNAVVAMDIYVQAQKIKTDPKAIRKQLNNRVSIGKRWARLCGNSPLRLLFFSANAERMM
ncbi:hypothetical protein B0T21DRAFT_284027 [Apiosordaria backusii]|uniref:Uncharacterized protein n=1 Tax=Apiosordaria backusii TaxID=314023 RepID=A0AA40BRM1_9PEZI|nr:hypothetical protein B0T21DRAFT_284027 [Apiosordaria backusii]